MTAEQIPFWDRLTCSVEEACMVTSLGRSSVIKMMDSGKLEIRKIGRRQLVLIRSLQALVAPPTSQPPTDVSSPNRR